MDKIKVGISIGDPNGIGIEIILSTFEDKSIFKKILRGRFFLFWAPGALNSPFLISDSDSTQNFSLGDGF